MLSLCSVNCSLIIFFFKLHVVQYSPKLSFRQNIFNDVDLPCNTVQCAVPDIVVNWRKTNGFIWLNKGVYIRFRWSGCSSWMMNSQWSYTHVNYRKQICLINSGLNWRKRRSAFCLLTALVKKLIVHFIVAVVHCILVD